MSGRVSFRDACGAVLLACTLWIAAPTAAQAQAGGGGSGRGAGANPDSTPAVRVHFRVVGVYDEETGEPVGGADVTDFFTRLTSRTTRTGTAALILGDTGGTLIHIKKVGYQPITMAVGTALSDTTPVTAVLLRAGHVLAPVITVGNRTITLGRSDTVAALLRNGFYERRETGGAPRSAFISGDKMQGTSLLTNSRYFGRPICESNVYIDGVKVGVPGRSGGHFLKEGIDALVDPSDVAGIETYRTGELPVGTAHTMSGPGTFDPAAAAAAAVADVAGTMAGGGCVTFIWLKG